VSHLVSVNIVSDGYFDLMGMQMIRGRDFTRNDVPAVLLSPTIVNQALAVSVFGGVDASVGQTFGIAGSTNKAGFTVIGVVSNAKYRTLREAVEPTYYVPLGPRELVSSPSLIYYRTTTKPLSLSSIVRSLIGPTNISIHEFTTLSDEIKQSIWKEMLLLYVAGGVSAVGIVMAGVAVFGFVSQFVIGHLQEIYIRLALGARPADLTFWVARTVIRPLGLGIAASIVLLVSIRQFVEPLMFQTRFADGSDIVIALAFVLCVFLVAVGLPVRRMLHRVSISPWQNSA
jgi:putative ABC transport system permease protein